MKKLLLFLFLAVCTNLQAQQEIGLSIGPALFKGDVNSRLSIKEAKPAIGLFYKYHYHDHLAFKTSFIYGSLKGADSRDIGFSYSDQFKKLRGLSFQSRFWEISATNEIYFIDNENDNHFCAYGYGGIGYMHFDPTAVLNGTKYHLRDLHTEGQGLDGYKKEYKLNAYTGIIGLGGKYEVSDYLHFGIEFGFRFTTTDYIDDVSGNYADPTDLYNSYGNNAVLLSDRSYEALTNSGSFNSGQVYYDAQGSPHVKGYGKSSDQRGSNKANDRFLVMNFTAAFVIPSGVRHGFMK